MLNMLKTATATRPGRINEVADADALFGHDPLLFVTKSDSAGAFGGAYLDSH